MVKYGLTITREADTGDGAVKLYGCCAAHKLLLVYTIMLLAQRLANYKENYRGFCGVPEEWFR